LYILVEKLLVFFLKECKMRGRAGNHLTGLRVEVDEKLQEKRDRK